MIGADAIVGLSTHDETQIAAAIQTTATYIAVGPIFGTAHQGHRLHGARVWSSCESRLATRTAGRGDRRDHARARAAR